MKNKSASVVLVMGGISSGKSEFAEQMISKYHKSRSGNENFYYFTPAAPPEDDEMRTKVAIHRNRRPEWLKTVECGLLPADHLGAIGGGDALLFDSVGTLAGRLLMLEPEKTVDEITEEICGRMLIFCRTAVGAGASVIMVTEEAGMTLVAMSDSGRKFQIVMGKVNQALAAEADEVFLVTAGLPQRLK